ncbi:hypothetical protein CDAR_442201 [Caerostris darwini]|uniref:Uncharacterized protein n=1 Tax=Caerostris darwini TaxID=1538125 RepID=A0AAV4V074_9ARAC|nr:hypothetical protein CDAR_442201 [Caerostris darwini]
MRPPFLQLFVFLPQENLMSSALACHGNPENPLHKGHRYHLTQFLQLRPLDGPAIYGLAILPGHRRPLAMPHCNVHLQWQLRPLPVQEYTLMIQRIAGHKGVQEYFFPYPKEDNDCYQLSWYRLGGSFGTVWLGSGQPKCHFT